MASRIIKQGSSRSSEIQQFLFAENYSNPASAPEQVHWPEVRPMTAVQDASLETSEPEPPGVDIAMLERSAYENGLRQGEKSGMAAAERKIEEISRRHADSILEIGRLKSSLYAQVEHEVAKLAIEVAKKIVHREIQADPEIIQTLVHVALSHVTEKTSVRVHVHPVDYDLIVKRQNELSQAESKNINLTPDKSIERGGCLIETDCGDIDARLEEKFCEVERAFFEGGS
jgi:flagellar assembly protein FliH